MHCLEANKIDSGRHVCATVGLSIPQKPLDPSRDVLVDQSRDPPPRRIIDGETDVLPGLQLVLNCGRWIERIGIVGIKLQESLIGYPARPVRSDAKFVRTQPAGGCPDHTAAQIHTGREVTDANVMDE
jgi:hypothetical protein